jgi:hypothetical protein
MLIVKIYGIFFVPKYGFDTVLLAIIYDIQQFTPVLKLYLLIFVNTTPPGRIDSVPGGFTKKKVWPK